MNRLDGIMDRMLDQDLENEWQNIKSDHFQLRKAGYAAYCSRCVRAAEESELTIEKAAYKICGISAQALGKLGSDQSNQLVSEIMDITCDLELPVEHRSRSIDDWEKISDLISKLR